MRQDERGGALQLNVQWVTDYPATRFFAMTSLHKNNPELLFP